MGKMATRLSRIFDNAVRAKVVSLEAMTKAKQQASQNLETMPSVECKGLEPSLNVELFTTQSARSTRTTIHQSATHTIA